MTIRCAHGYPCTAVALSNYSPSKRLRGCSFARCPNQENHCCNYFGMACFSLLYIRSNHLLVNLTEIYRPLMVASSALYPSPPPSSKHPSAETAMPQTPTKRRRIKKESSPPSSESPASPPLLSYFTPPPFKQQGPLLSSASDDGKFCLFRTSTTAKTPSMVDIFLFFTDLKDATIGRNGGLVSDPTRKSPPHNWCRS